jgi:ppGpp synthetase/RelA/SpoT-type nucleotidyltranferase
MVSKKDTENLDLLPAKEELKAVYESYIPVLTTIKDNIEQSLKKSIQLASMPTYKSRVKTFQSYYRKIIRVKSCTEFHDRKLICLTDMIGIRIICAFLEDLSVVESQIKTLYDVKEIEHKGAAQNFREFGYESVHILITIPEDCIPDQLSAPYPPVTLPDELVCEIQIRTILQDAWAEVEHELIYKSEFSPFDMPLRRKLASINASLNLADIIFQEIRDYQKELQGQVAKRRESFYRQVDTMTQSFLPVPPQPAPEKNIQRISPYIRGTVDDLLLKGLQAHNNGDLPAAIKIYTDIIKSEPAPDDSVMTVIHKHRGMAYFAENKYDEALADFRESEKYSQTNFRTIYYEGIVNNIKSNYLQAIDCFTRSLELNEFQSHAHFHRAVAYYQINDYENALKDLAAAEKLGLKDEECDALYKKLSEKLDMEK